MSVPEPSRETRLSAAPRRLALGVTVAILAGAIANAATGGEVYRWVDEDGRVHYSDTKPRHDEPVTVVEIEIAEPADYDPAADPNSILNQAAQIHQTWLDLEEARRARAQQRIDARAHSPRPLPEPAYDGYLEYARYPYYPVWPVGRPDYRPGTGRDQLHALYTLDLLGPRPASINSGAHLELVDRSQLLPLVPPAPRPQPR